jgi:GT2 family glycosyltransferase
LSRELAEKYDIDTKIIFNDANVGVARGNNQGIQQALNDGCTKVLLSNNDIEFRDPALIATMVKYLEDNGIEAVVPKIYYHSDPKRIWCAGGRFSLHAATTPHFGDGNIDCGQYDTARAIDYAPTCFMLLRSDVFRAIGMMDERYFVYYDDTDFVWRMKTARLGLHYWPKGQVWHKVSFSTGGAVSLFSLYYGFRNRIIFVRKNYPVVLQAFSMAYIYSTLAVKFLNYEREKRDAVRRGLRDGFLLKL